MTSPPPSDPAPHGTAMSAAAYGASRSTLWTGVSVLITDTAGRILLQRVTYRTTRLLPGGGVDAEEAPTQDRCSRGPGRTRRPPADQPGPGCGVDPVHHTSTPPHASPARSSTSSTAVRGTANRSPQSARAKARSKASTSSPRRPPCPDGAWQRPPRPGCSPRARHRRRGGTGRRTPDHTAATCFLMSQPRQTHRL